MPLAFQSKIRVEKPRIGGGFGAKQSSVSEVYPAFVTMKTGRPAQIIYTREDSLIAGSPRHEMEVHVRLGASKEEKFVHLTSTLCPILVPTPSMDQQRLVFLGTSPSLSTADP